MSKRLKEIDRKLEELDVLMRQRAVVLTYSRTPYDMDEKYSKWRTEEEALEEEKRKLLKNKKGK